LQIKKEEEEEKEEPEHLPTINVTPSRRSPIFTFKDISSRASDNSCNIMTPKRYLVNDFSKLASEVTNNVRAARAYSAADKAIIDEHEDSSRTVKRVSKVAHTEVNKMLDQI